MSIKYITIEDEEIVVDNRIMLSLHGKQFEPKGGGKWKLAGYVTEDKKITDTFKPGYALLFLDEAEEWLSYRFVDEKCRITEKPVQKYVSNPIKEMKE